MDEIARVYVDGAYRPKDGRGACAFVLMNREHEAIHEQAYCYANTTNNRMELWAAIHAIDTCNKMYPMLRPVITTDSKYLNNMQYWIPRWQRRGWRTIHNRPVRNLDVVTMFALVLFHSRHHVTSFWVKGHAGNEGNERAHNLAESALLEEPERDDIGGISLVDTEDLLSVCHPEDINYLLENSYRIGARALI